MSREASGQNHGHAPRCLTGCRGTEPGRAVRPHPTTQEARR